LRHNLQETPEFVIAVPKEQVKHEMGDKYDNNQITTSYQLLRLFPLSKGVGCRRLVGQRVCHRENGMIVTNSHVVNGATRIRVKGEWRGIFRHVFGAHRCRDARNDLALLRIDDPGFRSFRRFRSG
jgi:S1-C subfamily serine protease